MLRRAASLHDRPLSLPCQGAIILGRRLKNPLLSPADDVNAFILYHEKRTVLKDWELLTERQRGTCERPIEELKPTLAFTVEPRYKDTQ
jgi:hypothetical protein